MKKILGIFFAIFVLISFNACDDESKDESSSSSHVEMSYDLQFELPADLSGLTPESVTVYNRDGVVVGTYDGYSFDSSAGSYLEIIDSATLDAYDAEDDIATADMYDLFGYRILASDGFNPKDRDQPDLTWDGFELGYYIPSYDQRTWFPQFGDPAHPDFTEWNGPYQVKGFTYVQLFRKIDLINGATTTMITLQDYTNQFIKYWNNNHTSEKENQAIPLSSIITTEIASNRTTMNYVVTCADGWVNDDTLDTTVTQNLYDWDAISHAYITTDITANDLSSVAKIVFIDPADNTQPYKNCKYVSSIEIVIP